MIEPSTSHRILYLVTPGLDRARREELEKAAARSPEGTTDILELTELNSREALEKVFAADTIAVWGRLPGEKDSVESDG